MHGWFIWITCDVQRQTVLRFPVSFCYLSVPAQDGMTRRLPVAFFFLYFHSTVAAPKVVDPPTAIRNIFLVFLSQTSTLVPPYSLCLRACRTFLQTLHCSRRTRCIIHYLMSPTTPKTLPFPIFRNTDSLNPTESQAPPSRHHTGLTAVCNTMPTQ